MRTKDITVLLNELVSHFDGSPLLESEARHFMANREYTPAQIDDFVIDIQRAGEEADLLFLENTVPVDEFLRFSNKTEVPLLIFINENGSSRGGIIVPGEKKEATLVCALEFGLCPESLDKDKLQFLHGKEPGQVTFYTVFKQPSMVSEKPEESEGRKLNPVQRLLRLLNLERKDIIYIYVYAILVGAISLSLPLGIQATINLVSGGLVFSSVYVLIGVVIAGIGIGGGIQILQITIVEYLQRRVFTRAALELAIRAPRIQMERLGNTYAPELMNRFFDVLTLQKGLPKLLIDLSAAVLQILFGLLLLSFYHPFFVFFGFGVVAVLYTIFRITGPKGLRTSIMESKYKYKVAYWLEELARAMGSFKMAGHTRLPVYKTQTLTNRYLAHRKKHFGVLVNQFAWVLLFKVVVTGGLLIIGTQLVISRDITLGQLVAAEIVIVLIISSVEKMIQYLETVYDMLTAVDKIGQVTDFPIDKDGGRILPPTNDEQPGLGLSITNLHYRYEGQGNDALNGLNLDIKPGERVCVAGYSNSGKTTLTRIVTGLSTNYKGSVAVDGYSLRDLDMSSLRDRIAKNVSEGDLFAGTILENLTLMKPNTSLEDAKKALDEVGLTSFIQKLPSGLETEMVGGNTNFSSSVINRLLLARCFIKKPGMLILNDFFTSFHRTEKLQLIATVTAKTKPWTLIAVSNDPLVMAACDRIVVLKEGKVLTQGTYQELLQHQAMAELTILPQS